MVPYIIMRLEVARATTVRPWVLAMVAVEVLWNAAVNAETIYVFSMRPFSWAHESGIQRFMW